MKKNKFLKMFATLGLVVSLATSSMAPAYAAPREYQCVVNCSKTSLSGLLSGLASRLICKNFGHTYDKGVVVTEPTYTEEGVMKFTCYLCEATKNEVIDKLVCEDHEWVEVEYVECGGPGTEHGYWKDVCAVCGEVTEGIIHLYSYEHRELVSEGSETEHAVYRYFCDICGEPEEWEEHEFDLENPTIVESEEDAECGITYVYKCTLCDDTMIDPWHDFDYEFAFAEEGKDGYDKAVCKKCGLENINEVQHYLDWSTEVVIEEPNGKHGVSEYTCMNCGEKVLFEVCEFDFENAVKIDGEEGNCGTYLAKCKYCESTLEFNRHNYEWFEEEATKEHDGICGSKCTECGVFEYSFPKHFMDYENVTIIEEAAPGKHEVVEAVCANCGATDTWERHVYDEENPILIEQGADGVSCNKYLVKCLGCEESYEYESYAH